MATFVRGTAGNDDLRADPSGSMVRAGAGNDVIRGGKGDDIIIGGPGDDILWGGSGADQFRFFGNEIEGTSDTDRIIDLTFSEGDTLVFGNYNGVFANADGVNAFNGGDAAIISSWTGLMNAADTSGGRISITGNAGLDLLIITLDNGAGQTQVIRLSNSFAAYAAETGGMSG
ncbi:calcium-binding protein [Sphingomonas sp.]